MPIRFIFHNQKVNTCIYMCVCQFCVCVCICLPARSCPVYLGPSAGGLCSVLPSTVFFLSLHALPLFSSAGPAALLGSVPLILVSLTLSRCSQSLISRAGGHQQRAARPIIGPSPPVSREMADVSASNLLFTHETRWAMGFVSGKLLTIINATCIIIFFSSRISDQQSTEQLDRKQNYQRFDFN